MAIRFILKEETEMAEDCCPHGGNMFAEILKRLRYAGPLVHNITNYVTVNDCANIILAAGGSPIMADDPLEAAEVTAVSDGLNINMGTLSKSRLEAMLASGAKAMETGKPAVLDPVGVGVSLFRKEAAVQLMKAVRFSIIRGNMSEILTLAGESGSGRGVDAAENDEEFLDETERAAAFARRFAEKTGAVIVISGKTDIVSDSEKSYLIHGGSALMSRVSGTGCMLSALTAAFAAAVPDQPLAAAAAASAAMKCCGKMAEKRMEETEGTMSFRNYLIDAVSILTPEMLEKGTEYEVRS